MRIIVVLAILLLPSVSSATTSTGHAATCSNDSSNGGYDAWSGYANADNAGEPDGAVASAYVYSASYHSPGYSQYLKCLNYTSWDNPIEPNITSITVEVTRKCNLASTYYCRDYQLRLVKGGVVQSENLADTSTNWTTTLTSVNHGSFSVSGWAKADLDGSTFGVVFSGQSTYADSGSTARTVYIDSLRVIVESNSVPTPTNSPTPSTTQTPTITNTPATPFTPTHTPTNSPTITQSPTITPTPTITQTPTAIATCRPIGTRTASAAEFVTDLPVADVTPGEAIIVGIAADDDYGSYVVVDTASGGSNLYGLDARTTKAGSCAVHVYSSPVSRGLGPSGHIYLYHGNERGSRVAAALACPGIAFPDAANRFASVSGTAAAIDTGSAPYFARSEGRGLALGAICALAGPTPAAPFSPAASGSSGARWLSLSTYFPTTSAATPFTASLAASVNYAAQEVVYLPVLPPTVTPTRTPTP